MVFSFLCNGVIFGTINSSGVLFVYIKKSYKGDGDASAKVLFINYVERGVHVGSLTVWQDKRRL